MIISEVIPGQAGRVSIGDWRGISHVVFCIDRVNAGAFVSRFASSFPDKGRLLVICVGAFPDRLAIAELGRCVSNKKVIIFMDDDLLGRVITLKIAVWLKQKEVYLSYLPHELVELVFKGKRYVFPEQKVSLNAFEKAAACRSKIRTFKV